MIEQPLSVGFVIILVLSLYINKVVSNENSDVHLLRSDKKAKHRGSGNNALSSRELQLQLNNGEACSENSQCESNCCSWYLFGDDTCQYKRWWRNCIEGYDFKSSAETPETQCLPSPPLSYSLTSTNDIIKLMSYNVYSIVLASDIFSINRRMDDLTAWFAQNSGDYDVVAMQESWMTSKRIKNGMVDAGYCHYAYDDRGQLGSGLAIFSKYPIEEHDFRGFGDACALSSCPVDMGVIYARIRSKKGIPIHLFNTHTNPFVDEHQTRLEQYDIIRDFVNEKIYASSPPGGYVYVMGDLNEDKITTPDRYETMLVSLNVGEINFAEDSATKYSYNPADNSLIKQLAPGAGSDDMALDFIFYSRASGLLYPNLNDSECEYIKPKNDAGGDISDHYPIVCTIHQD